VLFQLINTRHETGSIVMTSNKPFSKWAELMSDEAVASCGYNSRIAEGLSLRFGDFPPNMDKLERREDLWSHGMVQDFGDAQEDRRQSIVLMCAQCT
jgi:hypothetical protein